MASEKDLRLYGLMVKHSKENKFITTGMFWNLCRMAGVKSPLTIKANLELYKSNGVIHLMTNVVDKWGINKDNLKKFGENFIL